IFRFWIPYSYINRGVQFLFWLKDFIFINEWALKLFSMWSIGFFYVIIKKLYGFYFNRYFYVLSIICFKKVILYLIVDKESPITLNFSTFTTNFTNDPS